MAVRIYLGGYPIGGVIDGCEFVGEAWVKAQQLAEMLDTTCGLVNAETGEVIAWWEP